MLRLLILFYEVWWLKCPSLACTGFILAFLQVRWRLYVFAARIRDNRGAFCLGTQEADEMDWSAFSHSPKWKSLLPLVVQVCKGTWVDCQPLLRSLTLPTTTTFQTLSTFFLKILWLLLSAPVSPSMNSITMFEIGPHLWEEMNLFANILTTSYTLSMVLPKAAGRQLNTLVRGFWGFSSFSCYTVHWASNSSMLNCCYIELYINLIYGVN